MLVEKDSAERKESLLQEQSPGCSRPREETAQLRGPEGKAVQRGEGRPHLANDTEPSLVPARLSG